MRPLERVCAALPPYQLLRRAPATADGRRQPRRDPFGTSHVPAPLAATPIEIEGAATLSVPIQGVFDFLPLHSPAGEPCSGQPQPACREQLLLFDSTVPNESSYAANVFDLHVPTV
jgi:hypothetical protein